MIYQTDIECAKCGGNLCATTELVEETLTVKVDPCVYCLAETHNEGVRAMTKHSLEIFGKSE